MTEMLIVLGDYWQAGGPVMYALLFVGVVIQAIFIDRAWALWGPASRDFRREIIAILDVDGASLQLEVWQQAALQHACQGLRLMQAFVAAAPLIGLLGTVSGMLVTFSDLSLGGGAGASGMARGIGQAMITTQMGLMLALPGLLMHRLLLRRAEALVSRAAAEAHINRSTRAIDVRQVRKMVGHS